MTTNLLARLRNRREWQGEDADHEFFERFLDEQLGSDDANITSTTFVSHLSHQTRAKQN